jgi:hypothetical protein
VHHVDGDELSESVFTELGRVTWAVIKLEDYLQNVSWLITPSDPSTDRRPISEKIKASLVVLDTWGPSVVRDHAQDWLRQGLKAIGERNAALHGTPLTWVGPDFRDAPPRMLLGVMPRGGRPYSERPLTASSLAELRTVLVDAAAGWRDLVIEIGEERRRMAAEEDQQGD